MQRRDFVRGTAVCAASLGLPISRASAQAALTPRRIGMLSFGSATGNLGAARNQAFVLGLREAGWEEGKTIVVERRYADGNAHTLDLQVKKLLESRVEVIVATSTITCTAAHRQTSTVPIVITATADPVGDGFADSLARPGKNITGMSTIAADTIQKHVELLALLEPAPQRIAVLVNPSDRAHPAQLDSARAAGAALNIAVSPVTASNKAEFALAFAGIGSSGTALLVLNDGLFFAERTALATLANERRLATIFGFRDGAEAGMLMSYGPDLTRMFHRSASFVSRILRGARPADLPFEQPTNFELVVNQRTARDIGVTFPRALLVRADSVIA